MFNLNFNMFYLIVFIFILNTLKMLPLHNNIAKTFKQQNQGKRA